MNRKKIVKIVKITLVAYLLFLLIFFLGEWIWGEGGTKRLYYNFGNYDGDKIRVVKDDNFIFDKQGFTKDYNLNSDYYISHRILLIPNSKIVPIDYRFSGELLIEFFDGNGELLKSTKVSDFNNILRRKGSEKDDYYSNYLIYVGKQARDAGSVFAFEIGEIPFDLICLKWKRLKNMKIKITVINPEEGLLEYCDIATLVVIPDLRL